MYGMYFVFVTYVYYIDSDDRDTFKREKKNNKIKLTVGKQHMNNSIEFDMSRQVN